jgi:hypothetical protein
MIRNTPPPLASNDLLCGIPANWFKHRWRRHRANVNVLVSDYLKFGQLAFASMQRHHERHTFGRMSVGITKNCGRADGSGASFTDGQINTGATARTPTDNLRNGQLRFVINRFGRAIFKQPLEKLPLARR